MDNKYLQLACMSYVVVMSLLYCFILLALRVNGSRIKKIQVGWLSIVLAVLYVFSIVVTFSSKY